MCENNNAGKRSKVWCLLFKSEAIEKIDFFLVRHIFSYLSTVFSTFHLLAIGTEMLFLWTIRFNPTPLPIIRQAPAKKFNDRVSSKMTTPAIPVKTTSDIKITPPSEALHNLNPWFMRIWPIRKITASKTNREDCLKSGSLNVIIKKGDEIIPPTMQK